MAQLMPLPLTVCCFSKVQIGFPFLVRADPGRSGQNLEGRKTVVVVVVVVVTVAVAVAVAVAVVVVLLPFILSLYSIFAELQSRCSVILAY